MSDSFMVGADGPTTRLLDAACGVDLGFNWKHFTIVACCNEWAVTAKKVGDVWYIRDMVCIPAT